MMISFGQILSQAFVIIAVFLLWPVLHYYGYKLYYALCRGAVKIVRK